MKIRELINQHCKSTEKKGNGTTIHTLEVSQPIEKPEFFSYLDSLSDGPSRKIWASDPYRMILTEIDGEVTLYEYVRLANYRIQLYDFQEKYGGNDEGNLPAFTDVFTFAFNEHKNSARKSGTPYISHPMDVASILLKENTSSELVLAGLLHDIVEDTDVDIATILRRYGQKIADYVSAVTEPEELRQAADANMVQNWKERKEYTIRKISRANSDIKLLSCADKLANIRDLISDIRVEGEGFWDKFNAAKDDQEWYYRSMLNAFATGPQNIIETRAYYDFRKCVEELF